MTIKTWKRIDIGFVNYDARIIDSGIIARI